MVGRGKREMKDIRATILMDEKDKKKLLNADLDFVEYENDEKIEVLLDSDGDGFYKRNVDKRLGRTAAKKIIEIINWLNTNLRRKFSLESFDIGYNGFDGGKDERIAQEAFWATIKNAQSTVEKIVRPNRRRKL